VRYQPNRAVLHWTEMITGLEAARTTAALEQIAAWGYAPLSDELLAPTVDAVVAATLLVEGLDFLVDHGADEARIRKKLRQDRQVWGTWAEVRAADILLRWMPEAELRIEEGRSGGAHADLRFVVPHGAPGRSVEVKAIGLSDEEVAFCERMAPKLKSLVPRVGLGHLHAPIDAATVRHARQIRVSAAAEAKSSARAAPRYPRGLRGAAIVGHGSESAYARRVAGRVVQAVRQLPEDDDCWVGIFWSNGAPATTVHAAIPWREIPRHVTGIVLLGSGVAFPHRNIHAFAHVIHRDVAANSELALRSLDGEGMEEIAGLVLDRFERSSGVGATLLKGGERTVLLRDGRRRILPFNLLLDRDPPLLDREAVGTDPGTRRGDRPGGTWRC
jgi:hypothetical protein